MTLVLLFIYSIFIMFISMFTKYNETLISSILIKKKKKELLKY